MGYIKEPEGIDFVVEPSILTQEDRLKISKIIAEYKQKGTIPIKSQSHVTHGRVLMPSRRTKILQ